MTFILGFAGKKQSGKNTATNFIFGMEMIVLDVIDAFDINDQGQLVVPAVYNDSSDEVQRGIYDPIEPHKFNLEHVWPHIRIYSFADGLKQLCIDIMGLTYAQCYGTNEDKNIFTEYRWKDMPDYQMYTKAKFDVKKGGFVITDATQQMTARHVLQYIGTNIFRRMKGDIWAEACIRKIQKDSPNIALISDCRFPNEVEVIQRAGGKVIKLLRNPIQNPDPHPSEIALDEGNFDQSKFDSIFDNSEMSINEQNKAMTPILQQFGLWQ